jgi:hypothetical protein
MRIREAQKHTDPEPDADPDPQHCFIMLYLFTGTVKGLCLIFIESQSEKFIPVVINDLTPDALLNSGVKKTR